ncbi:MAG TPA: peptidase S8 [Pseudonocardiaceae bacterium]|nr:peptidase S8 [Pseudonocardiaceae bacterium]
MRTIRRLLTVGTAGVVTLAFATAVSSPQASAATVSTPLADRLSASLLTLSFPCASGAGQEYCQGKMKAKRNSRGLLAPLLMSTPTGYESADIRSAYNLKGTSSGGRTVAIVDAYDDPNAEADLAVYRSHNGLSACTTANGCFHKYNGNGASSPLPAADAGWGLEESLDLDMVSATCPDCKIDLVEGSTADNAPMFAAEDSAAKLPGVVAVSNSWGSPEATSDTTDDAHFNHSGVAITASSGDSGYGALWPASSPYVTAAGGTSLTKASNARGWSETAWSGAGSGCSAYEPKPSWQHDTGCSKRTVADVSAVADPNTGVAVYDTYNTCGSYPWCDFLIEFGVVQGADGWIEVGGTSAASPIIASVYALAGNTPSISGSSYVYSHTGSLNDVTSGSNGSCSGSYLCTAGPGYDGPTGWGTPNGTGAF